MRSLALWLAAVMAWPIAAAERWSPERAQQWAEQTPWLVGCNYLPSTAINQLEMWQADSFDPETIDRELGWAEDLGFTSVRVFLHDLPWKEDPEGFFSRVDRFLEIADSHGIGVMMVIFDGVWDPNPVAGPQRAPQPGVHNSGWVQSPGKTILADPELQDQLQPYVTAVVKRYRTDERIQVWDLFNEPDNPNTNSYGAEELADKDERAAELVRKSFAWARDADPVQPLTVGVWRGPAWSNPSDLNLTHQAALELSDVISFHDYGDAQSMRSRIEQLRTYERPLLCTEYMARGNGSTFADILPILKAEEVGAYNWGLVDGKSQTKYPWSTWQQPILGDPNPWHHDIFRTDGTPYSETEIQTIRQLTGAANGDDVQPVEPVSFNKVELQDEFWAPRLETNRDVTVWYDLQKCEETHRIANFAVAGGLQPGVFHGIRYNDSDVFKVMEGAAYSLVQSPDPKLEAYLDELIAKIAAAQEDDGYLFTPRTIDPNNMPRNSGDQRWSLVQRSHELYNVGHLYEAAVAHFQATGKRTLLDVALRNADLVCDVFGPGEDQRQDVPGHQEIELALVKLYRVTGDEKYLEQAEFFLDQRGRSGNRELYGSYCQDHLPVTMQREPVGHAVRATYMYAAMADVAALKGREDYLAALSTIWNRLLDKKIYVTGGIGAEAGHEGFGPDYHLPNGNAYNETCAAIGLALWSHRMFLLQDDAQYLDVLERVLYNGMLSGVSSSGDRFFYPNPLESDGQVQRRPWFSTSCCPVNIVRLLPAVPGFVYGTQEDAAYVNLFVSSSAELLVGQTPVTLEQSGDYPWSGDVEVRVSPAAPATFAVKIRIPGWARNRPLPSDLYRFENPQHEEFQVRVNGQPVDVELERGFAVLERRWQVGDTVQLHLPMPVRRVVARPEVAADRGRFAVQRGPLVYCAEGVDNEAPVRDTIFPEETRFEIEWQPDLLEGLVRITMHGGQVGKDAAQLQLVPYYAWANRGAAEMLVWYPTSEEARYQKRVGIPDPRENVYDYVDIASRKSEREHDLQGERTGSGPAGEAHWRHATGGGWFSYTLDLPSPGPVDLVCTYWGSDSGGRIFEILVEDQKVATEQLNSERPGEFFERRYELPAALTAEPGKLTVRFDAHEGRIAGGVFGVQLVPRKSSAE